jgi:hypothetical protein
MLIFTVILPGDPAVKNSNIKDMLFGAYPTLPLSPFTINYILIIKSNDNICSPHLHDHYQYQALYLCSLLYYIIESSSPAGSGISHGPQSQTNFYQAFFVTDQAEPIKNKFYPVIPVKPT